MIFILHCTDKPGALQIRLDTRPAHVAYLTKLNEQGTLKFAGPYLGADGKPIGSLVAIEVADADAAQAIAKADPYAQAGLFATVEMRPWTWTFNNPANG